MKSYEVEFGVWWDRVLQIVDDPALTSVDQVDYADPYGSFDEGLTPEEFADDLNAHLGPVEDDNE